MQIWVDADACPGEIKEMLYRAAKRREILVTLVANQVLAPPKSSYISTILVPEGANVADRRIVELASPGDLVITADIPLAALVVAKGARAQSARRALYRRQRRRAVGHAKLDGRHARRRPNHAGTLANHRRRPAGLRQSTGSLADHRETAPALIATRCHPPALARKQSSPIANDSGGPSKGRVRAVCCRGEKRSRTAVTPDKER
jgi:uncharacterized protein YaiI (UPF0178 family)